MSSTARRDHWTEGLAEGTERMNKLAKETDDFIKKMNKQLKIMTKNSKKPTKRRKN